MADFIGIEALQQIATKYSKEIAVGAAHFRPDVFDRMRIRVITGEQFKDIKHVMNRKGHTTERKVVGKPVNSTLGYLEEREMVCHLAWNHYTDNKDNYIEKAVVAVDGSATFSYPLSELAFNEAVKQYGEDIFNCLWHGDDTIPDEKTLNNWYLRLYTGFITYLNNDVMNQRISVANKNLVTLDAIDAPATVDDTGAWKIMKEFRNKWSVALRNAPLVLVYCSDETGDAIATAYGNSKNNNQGVIYLDNGNFKVPEWRNVEFCPESSFGVGEKLIATTPYNFEYGVNTLDSRTKISVRMGSDNDHDDISFQVQSVQGTRVLNVNASNFCMSDAALVPADLAGDYTKNIFVVTSNDESLGTVKVNDATPDNTKDYAKGTSLRLKAEATSTNNFLGWSNGQTAAEITVVTKGIPEAITAFFQASDD